MTDTPVLVARGLSKRFGQLEALRGVDLEIQRGEVVGFLGPNGAGKSTTMKIITGFLAADAGTVAIGGIDQQADPLGCRKLVGYLPEEVPLWLDMTVESYLDHVARLKGIVGGARRKAVVEAMAATDSTVNAKRRIRALSKGNRQRAALAQALLGDPPLLVLDEPTSGLDPAQVANFRDQVRRLAAGRAVLLSTHVMGEVAAVCDRVIVVHRGRTLLSGPIGLLRERAARAARVGLRLRAPNAAALAAILAATDWARVLPGDGDDHLTVEAPPERRAELVALAEANGGLRELNEERVPLEEVFRDLVAADQPAGATASRG
jgi:ABC-2 type transport system ATP-binding protein